MHRSKRNRILSLLLSAALLFGLLPGVGVPVWAEDVQRTVKFSNEMIRAPHAGEELADQCWVITMGEPPIYEVEVNWYHTQGGQIDRSSPMQRGEIFRAETLYAAELLLTLEEENWSFAESILKEQIIITDRNDIWQEEEVTPIRAADGRIRQLRITKLVQRGPTVHTVEQMPYSVGMAEDGTTIVLTPEGTLDRGSFWCVRVRKERELDELGRSFVAFEKEMLLGEQDKPVVASYNFSSYEKKNFHDGAFYIPNEAYGVLLLAECGRLGDANQIVMKKLAVITDFADELPEEQRYRMYLNDLKSGPDVTIDPEKDDEAVQQLKQDTLRQLEQLTYDGAKTLAENKAAAYRLIVRMNHLKYRSGFDEAKQQELESWNGLTVSGAEAEAIRAQAIEVITAMTFDPDETPYENQQIVYAVSELWKERLEQADSAQAVSEALEQIKAEKETAANSKTEQAAAAARAAAEAAATEAAGADRQKLTAAENAAADAEWQTVLQAKKVRRQIALTEQQVQAAGKEEKDQRTQTLEEIYDKAVESLIRNNAAQVSAAAMAAVANADAGRTGLDDARMTQILRSELTGEAAGEPGIRLDQSGEYPITDVESLRAAFDSACGPEAADEDRITFRVELNDCSAEDPEAGLTFNAQKGQLEIGAESFEASVVFEQKGEDDRLTPVARAESMSFGGPITLRLPVNVLAKGKMAKVERDGTLIGSVPVQSETLADGTTICYAEVGTDHFSRFRLTYSERGGTARPALPEGSGGAVLLAAAVGVAAAGVTAYVMRDRLPIYPMSGRVLDAKNRPLANVKVELLHEGRLVKEIYTDAEGSFRLRVPKQSYTLRVKGQTFALEKPQEGGSFRLSEEI